MRDGEKMKANHQSFDMKVVFGDRVYLSARDCARALGYETKKAFLLDNQGIVKRINGISELVSEDDYNNLLVKKPEAFDTQHSIEMTKVTTLNAKLSSFIGMYGLKLVLARSMYEAKAR